MSDTDEEVIPSSQPADVSMISPPSSQVKRSRDELSSEEDQASQPVQASRGMDDQLSCGICLDIMDNPFAVLPCMHSYCRECLQGWWREHANCPICKQRSTVGRHNHFAAGVITSYRRSTNRVARRKLDDANCQDIYPLGRRPPISLPSSILDSQSQSQPSQFDPLLMIPSFPDASMGSQSQSFPQPLPDTMPGGNLVFPCPSCLPGHVSGHRCPEPIIMPTPEQVAAQQEAYRPNGAPIRAPLRGERRVDLNAARLNALPGANSHNICASCTTYIPAGWEPQQQRCSDCGIVLCSNYDSRGCPDGHRLLPRNALSNGVRTANTLWNSCPFLLRSNVEEARRFQLYLHSKEMSIDQVLEGLVDLKLRNEKQAVAQRFPPNEDGAYDEDMREAEAECDAKWGSGNYFCDDFVNTLTIENFFAWWLNERRTAQLPASMSGLEDCWYGFECRTQGRQSHGGRYNHTCLNTSGQHQNGGV